MQYIRPPAGVHRVLQPRSRMQVLVDILLFYLSFVLFYRVGWFIRNLIVLVGEQLKETTEKNEALERKNKELESANYEHKRALDRLQYADRALARAQLTTDPYEMSEAAEKARIGYMTFYLRSDSFVSPMLSGSIRATYFCTDMADDNIDRLRALAVAMGTHRRLGQNSPLLRLAPEILEELGLISIRVPWI